MVAFESPRRLRTTLTVIASRWPERRLAVCRELTKMHEEVLRGTAAEVQDMLPETVRGEIVLVLEPTGRAGQSAATGTSSLGAESVEERVRAALTELIRLGVGTKKAATIVAGFTGLPSRQVYGRRSRSRRRSERRLE